MKQYKSPVTNEIVHARPCTSKEWMLLQGWSADQPFAGALANNLDGYLIVHHKGIKEREYKTWATKVSFDELFEEVAEV